MLNLFEKTASLDAMHLSIVVADANRHITFVNKHFTDLTGYSIDELIGKSCAILQGLDTDIQETLRLKSALTQGQAYQGELLNYRKDGSVFFNELNITPITDSHGEIIQFLGIQRDITDKKHLTDQLKASEQSFYALANGSPMMISISGLDKKNRWFNNAWKDFVGHSSSTEISNRWKTYVHPDDLLRILDVYVMHFNQSLPFQLEYRLKDKSGEYRWIEHRSVPRFDTNNVFIGYINYCLDITEARKSEVANDFFNHSQDMVYSTDVDGFILNVNDRFVEVSGYSREELLGQHIRIIKSGLHDSTFYKGMWDSIHESGYWRGEVTNRNKSGKLYSAVSSINRIQNSNGNFERYLAIASDITGIIEKRKQLEHLAYYDTLTGLPNRVLLNDRIEQAISHAKRNKGFLAVLFLDFDGFKTINDRFGHDAGDAFLVGISHAISDSLRESDTVARLGGDEFVILLTEITQIADISIPLKKLLRICNKSVHFKNYDLQASASIGCSLFTSDMEYQLIDAQSLLHRADQAMYVAKQLGKNRYHIFDEAIDQKVNTRSELLVEMQAAFDRGEFVLHYQPKVNMRTGAIVGVEALIRWSHPVHGLLQPSSFLPLVEDHYLNIELGEWVIQSALSQLHQWQSQELSIPISINIHPDHLEKDGFAQFLQKILAQYPDYIFGSLEIEILESGVLHNPDGVRRTLMICQAMGVSFTLDDFGTGYSSLNAIRQLPAKAIKVDRSFIKGIEVDESSRRMLEGLYHMVTKLDRELIVEGVETIEQGQVLIEIGYDYAQGYAIAKPMPAEEIPVWQQSWKPPKAWRLSLFDKVLNQI
jgi:diguanylate cyclase (GGDEF)-like protein/PAS domain S-box-containing protein